MAQLIRGLQGFYDRAMELQEPRVTHLPLMGSPLPMLYIVAAYVYFVRYLGPKLMQNRPPMEIRSLMIVYDIIVISINFYMAEQSTTRAFLSGRYHIYKEPVDNSTDPDAVEVAFYCWVYFMTKILDLLDTVKQQGSMTNLQDVHAEMPQFNSLGPYSLGTYLCYVVISLRLYWPPATIL